jgi:hypothetical protein
MTPLSLMLLPAIVPHCSRVLVLLQLTAYPDMHILLLCLFVSVQNLQPGDGLATLCSVCLPRFLLHGHRHCHGCMGIVIVMGAWASSLSWVHGHRHCHGCMGIVIVMGAWVPTVQRWLCC